MRILILTRYERLGSSSRVRFYQYIPYLASNNVEVTVAPLLGDDYVRGLYEGRRPSLFSILAAYARRIRWLMKSSSFDLIWLEKELLPWVPAWGEMILEKMGIPYVVDYDDAVFHRYDLHRNRWIRFLLGKKIKRVMQYAALVVVGNDYLKDHAIRSGAKRVAYLPSVVDGARYLPTGKPAHSPFIIGWIGSPVTAPFLEAIRPSLETLVHQGGAEIILVGSGGTDSLPQIPKTILPWSEEMETSISGKFDVGIMPLPDGPFEKGKCGYKLIQYMAAGLPVVASAVGINRRIVDHDVNGFLADSESEWTHALEFLRDNPEAGRQMGSAGRIKFESEFDLKVTAPQLLALLKQAARH